MTTTDPPAELDRALSRRPGRRGRARDTALYVVVPFVLAACVLWAARPAGRGERLEIDEAEWLTMSIHDALQITEGVSPFAGLAPSPYHRHEGDPWEVGIHQSTFGFMNPMLPKLVFGSVCLALGHRDYDPAVYPRFAKELPSGRAERALEAARAAAPPVRALVLALAALCAALLFRIARAVGGTAAGVATLISFLASPNVVDHATRIRTDFFPIAFGLAALCAAVARARADACGTSRGGSFRTAVLFGVLAGLAVGSKLNGALVAIQVGVFAPLLWAARRRASGVSFVRDVLQGWIVASALCAGLFVLCMPHLWTQPLEGLATLWTSWQGDLAHQAELFGERLGRGDTLGARLALALRGLAGRYEPLHALTGLALGAPLQVAGLAWLARRAREAASAALVVAYVIVVGLGTALWLPFGRDNFFLAFAPVVALLEGLAVGALAALLWSRFRGRERARAG